jgi:hypothetical protein
VTLTEWPQGREERPEALREGRQRVFEEERMEKASRKEKISKCYDI